MYVSETNTMTINIKDINKPYTATIKRNDDGNTCINFEEA